jgi:DnaJ-class molecular chaperone
MAESFLTKWERIIKAMPLRRTIKCATCDGFGRVNHRCGMVCVDDECPVCFGSGRVPIYKPSPTVGRGCVSKTPHKTTAPLKTGPLSPKA